MLLVCWSCQLSHTKSSLTSICSGQITLVCLGLVLILKLRAQCPGNSLSPRQWHMFMQLKKTK